MRVLVVVAALLSVAFAPRARAASATLEPAKGGTVLRLEPSDRGWAGEVTVRAVGGAVDGVHLAIDEGTPTSPRSPQGVAVEGASALRSLAEGGSRKVTVRWSPPDGQRARFAQGFIVLRSADGEVARLGFRADRGGSVPVLGLLVALPLAFALVLGTSHFARWGRERVRRRVAVTGAVLQLAVLAWLAARLDGAASRLDGNDGYAVLERVELSRSAGLEWALGLDGLSLVLLSLVSATMLSAALLGGSASRRASASAFVAFASMTGALLAADGRLLAVFVAAAAVSLAVVLGDAVGSRAVAPFAACGVGAAACLGVTMQHLATASAPRPMVSGAQAPTAYLPELSRSDLLGAGPLAGFAAVPVATVLVLGAVVLLCALGPLQSVLGAVARAPASSRLIVLGGFALLGPYVLLRVGFGVLAPGMQWAGTTLAALGLAGAVWSGLGCVGARDLDAIATSAAGASGAFSLAVLAGFTPQAVQAAILGAAAQVVVAVLLLAPGAFVAARAGSTELGVLGGLVRAMPRAGAVAGLGVLAAAGVPATPGFGARAAGVVGALALHPIASAGAVLALVLVAAGVARGFSAAFLGEVPAHWARSPKLEPHGGRFPDLREGELLAVLPAAFLLVVVGSAPRSLLGFTDGVAMDAASAVLPEGPLKIVQASPPQPLEIARR